MRAFFFWLPLVILFGAVPAEVKAPADEVNVIFDKMGYGQDRCCAPGCMARVAPGAGQLITKIRNESLATAVYFDEDSSALEAQESSKIDEFLMTYGSTGEIALVGYTDSCGSWPYNKALSRRRADTVFRKIKQKFPNARVKTHAAGEIARGHDPKSRKVYITLSKNIVLREPPPKIVADFYLLDSSGSMSGSTFELYRRAINYHRPRGSKVYVATTGCIPSMTRFSGVNPAGGTEIWYAYWKILDKMQPGQTLAVISDFDSNYPLTRREADIINRKIAQKGVKVKIIRM